MNSRWTRVGPEVGMRLSGDRQMEDSRWRGDMQEEDMGWTKYGQEVDRRRSGSE